MSPSLPKRQHAVDSASDPPPRMPAGDAFNTVIMQVIRLIRDFTAAGEALARPAGQTLARWLVLETIQQAPATVAEIARRLGLARQSVQREADLRRASVVLDRVSAALGSRSPDEFTQPGT